MNGFLLGNRLGGCYYITFGDGPGDCQTTTQLHITVRSFGVSIPVIPHSCKTKNFML